MRTWRFRLLLLSLVFILVAAGVALLLVTRPRPSHLLMYRSDAGGHHLNDLDTGEDILLENSSPIDPQVRERTSPDGRWIAFMSNHQNSNDDIYVIGADGTGFQQITSSSAFEDYPQWMP